jgi:acyl carrier protein
MMSEKLYQIISNVMKMDISLITDELGPETIENWTSFNGYVLLSELESGFDVKFTINEAMDVRNIADIKRHLRNKGIDVDE